MLQGHHARINSIDMPTYTLDASKSEQDSRGDEIKKGEWLPFCTVQCCGCEYGLYKPCIAQTCYTTPAEGKGTWAWCCLIPVCPMGGVGTVEKKENGDLLFEHSHYGPFHGGVCCLRGSWHGKGYMAKDGASMARV